MNKTIGILALQGDVVEHIDHFERIGVPCRPVRRQNEFDNLAGLVIPGGESTCLHRLMTIFGLDQTIRERFNHGMKVWGTCAGAILAADNVVGEGPKLGLIPMSVQRNAFGSQLESFHTQAAIPRLGTGTFPLTFIRAPKILDVGEDVDILLRMRDFIAMVESERVLATVFHPELTPSLAFHRLFAQKCGLDTSPHTTTDDDNDENWTPTSWTRLCPINRPTST